MILRCSNCILPVNLPGVWVDSKGKCNYCLMFDKISSEAPSHKELGRKFEKILNQYRAKGEYDCLVPVSGGKDSTYCMLVAKKYGMRALGFNYNNCWQSPNAYANIQRMVSKLNVDILTYKPEENWISQLHRIFLIRAGDICTPCNMLIGGTIFKFAKQNKIRLILTGGGERWSSAINGLSVSKYANHPYFFNVLERNMDKNKILNYLPPSLENRIVMKLRGNMIRSVNVFDYINIDKVNIREIIKEEAGWEEPSEEYEHGDCLLNALKDYIVWRRWGCSEVTGAYASLVRNGGMSREKAMEKSEEEEVKEEPEIVKFFLERIGVSHKEFEEVITYNHFSNFSNKEKFVFDVARKCYLKLIVRYTRGIN